MAITDELREYAHDCCARVDDAIHAIADRIDAEHAEAQRRWMAELEAGEQSFNAGFDDGFASADDWLAQHEDAMREHGWVRLPVDADGEPIHVGDVMEYTDKPNEPLTVSSINLEKNGWWVFSDGMGRRPDKYRHHKQLTVEDVLREMLYKAHIYYEREMELLPDLIAEYAKRLTLRGDAE